MTLLPPLQEGMPDRAVFAYSDYKALDASLCFFCVHMVNAAYGGPKVQNLTGMARDVEGCQITTAMGNGLETFGVGTVLPSSPRFIADMYQLFGRDVQWVEPSGMGFLGVFGITMEDGYLVCDVHVGVLTMQKKNGYR